MLRIATVVAVVGAIGLTACGGDGDTYTAPTQASPPASPPAGAPAPDETASKAAAYLSSTPGHYMTIASATLSLFDSYAWSPRASNECSMSGYRRILLNGTLLDGTPQYASLPTGKHSLVAQFDKCQFAGPMQDLLLDGRVDLAYEGSPTGSYSAVLTMRQFTSDGLVGLLADGPAAYTIEQQPQLSRFLVDLRPGATLTNPVTAKRIDFVSGRYSRVSERSAAPNSGTVETEEFLGIALDFDGVRYLLEGRIVVGTSSPCSGEVRITDGSGGLVARQSCSGKWEVLRPIPPFF